MEALSTYRPESFVKKTITPVQIGFTMDQLGRTKGIATQTAIRATSELTRKGAANARAKDTISVEIKCSETQNIAVISRYDLRMALYGVTRHKTIRKLAEAMAPMMLTANLEITRRVPTADLSGDLSSKINRNLAKKAQNVKEGQNPPEPLTRAEAVCCCTYAQWMPNLNELCGSNSLKSLMEEDYLLLRNSKRAKKTKQQDKLATSQEKVTKDNKGKKKNK